MSVTLSAFGPHLRPVSLSSHVSASWGFIRSKEGVMGPIRPPAAPAVWYVGVRNVAFLIAKGQKLSGGKCGPRPSAGTVLLLQTVYLPFAEMHVSPFCSMSARPHA